MHLTRLTLRNWRSFKNLDVELGQRLVIIGPNASGKSNLLDAVRFLRDLARPDGGLQDAMTLRGGLSRVRCLFARNNNRGHVTVCVSLGTADDRDAWTYRVSVKAEPAGRRRLLVTEEVVTKDGVEILRRPDDDDAADPERLTQTALEQISENRHFRELAHFLSEVRYLHLVPQVIRDSARSGDLADDPFGGDFIARMNAVPERTRNAWLRRVTAALRSAVPRFESLAVVVDAAGRPHLEAKYTNWRSSGSRQDEREFNDGTLRLIGLLWSLVEGGRKGAPILLEEPELSLHPAVVRLLPGVLARAQRGSAAQVLLTTHSPDLLSDEGLAPDEVLVLIPTDDGTTGSLLSQDVDAVAMIESGLTVAEVALPRSAPEDVDALMGVDLVVR